MASGAKQIHIEFKPQPLTGSRQNVSKSDRFKTTFTAHKNSLHRSQDVMKLKLYIMLLWLSRFASEHPTTPNLKRDQNMRHNIFILTQLLVLSQLEWHS